MHRTLRRDIFDIKFPGFPIEKVSQPSPNPLAAIQYACVYWVDHLQHGWCHKQDDVILDEGGCVDLFLQQKYLNWLEALSILGSISQGIVALLKLEDLLQVSVQFYVGDLFSQRKLSIDTQQATSSFASSPRYLPVYSVLEGSH